MVILGLGSNVGDRLAHLRQALTCIKKIPGTEVLHVSPVYLSDALLPENAPPEWDMPHLNLAIYCKTLFKPHDLLKELKNIEWSIGRKPTIRHWGPRIVDIDILAWDDVVIRSETLTVPHENLQERPFALWPLADVAPFWKFPLSGANHGKTAAEMVEKWGSRFTGSAPLHTRQIYQRIDTAQLVGILNITPDSFSDGGQFLKPEEAVIKAESLVNDGAEIIDIGAESTAPSSKPIDAATEWARLYPVLTAIKNAENHFMIKPKISIDTRHVLTAKNALMMGIDWINDVSGLDDPAMRDLIKHADVHCVIMHHLNIPERREHVLPRHQDPTKEVYEWGKNRIEELEQLGIAREKIIFDPGIGFGKMAEQSLALLNHVQMFKELGVRELIGHSRKTFISLLSPLSSTDRDIETMVISLYLAKQGIDYLRVHNVEMCARGLRTAYAMAST